MGYYASSTAVNFTIPADKVDAALAAVNADFPGAGTYTTLSDAVEENTCFMECEEGGENGFSLGYHTEKWLSHTEQLLGVLAPFATEGSYVRLSGEDDSLFGYRVIGGRLREEFGEPQWSLYLDREATEELENARIAKTTITFTVLHRVDEPLPNDLAAVLEATDTGNAVGGETRVTERVPDSAVRGELLALGNDGDFFNEED